MNSKNKELYQNYEVKFDSKEGNYKVKDKETEKKYVLNSEQFKIYKKITKKNKEKQDKKNEELVSFYNDMITFQPFQYKPYLNLISDENKEKCIYIADEVGVGKTFETGIILSELLYSGRIDLRKRILIICPNMLCKKWQEVLNMFFGLSSTIIKDMKESSNISIISFDSISNCKNIEEVELGVLIIDEAHNVSNARHEKIMKIREESQYTILLSATPLSGRDKDLNKQIELLFGKNNINENDFTFEIESCYFNRTLKEEMRKEKVKWHINNILIQNDRLKDYIKICEKIFNGRNTLKKFVGVNMIGSSVEAAKKYFDGFLNLEHSDIKKLLLESKLNKEDIYEYGFENWDEFLENICDENIEIEDIISNEEINDVLIDIKKLVNEDIYGKDYKFEALQKIIEENKLKSLKNEDSEHEFYKKIVVFVNFNETAHYLNDNIDNSILINGEIDISEKWKRFNEFKNPQSGKDVLIITNVACEGQDMDFCNTIVNYDLTYNPIQLAQRKGRIDRFEVKKPDLFIYNFCIENVDPSDEEIKEYIETNDINILKKYKNSIYSVLLNKLQEIKKSTGIYYNIIDTIGKTIESDEVLAKDKVVEVFKSMYGEEISTFESIEKIYMEQNKNKYKRANKLLEEKKISIEEKEDGISINSDKNNREFLKYVYDGGTLNSHLIYNNK